jgi:hypothetical protein
MAAAPLTALTIGQPIVFGGDRVTEVDAASLPRFPGDRLLVDQATGEYCVCPPTNSRRRRRCGRRPHCLSGVERVLTIRSPGSSVLRELLAGGEVIAAIADSNAATWSRLDSESARPPGSNSRPQWSPT